MKRWQVFLLVGLMTMGINLFKWVAALAAIAAAIKAATGVYNATKEPDAPPEETPTGYYQRSMFMPELETRSPYAPENRQMQTGPSPGIVNYLSKYVR